MDNDDDRGEPTCFNGEYHDWTYVEAWEGKPAHNYCATCGYRETLREKPETVNANG